MAALLLNDSCHHKLGKGKSFISKCYHINLVSNDTKRQRRELPPSNVRGGVSLWEAALEVTQSSRSSAEGRPIVSLCAKALNCAREDPVTGPLDV
ncbi:hypothetical protein ATANTOWER_022566 [Ataeniobius toweri]|uniref:Uncharacterized protein n=1 Tax=Ataeniobius toweri TaxID=208326 RepID=A0ABU7C3E5_9TELE|nr:hypothetical protein [Ataeniobius toweri]